jgi:predicted permease
MSAAGEWSRRVWYRLNRRRFEAALRQEMEEHRARMGDPVRFGNTLRLREDAGDVWGWRRLDQLTRDLRLAARTLRRSPGFSIASIASLAIGFALTASTVAVLNAYLLRSLPYPAADRLYHVMYAPPGPWEPGGMSALDWRSVDDVVEHAVTAGSATYFLTDAGYSQSVRALGGSPGLVAGLGVQAVAGRSLDAADFATGSDPVAMISHALWRDRYGSDPAIVGRQLRAEPESGGPPASFQIVGVLRPDFYFGRDSQARVDLLVPLTTAARTYMVRLREGVPAGYAEQRITQAARAVATGLTPEWTGVHLESAKERYVGQMRPVLAGVTVASALVLVVVCANVAVLMVLRSIRREKEIAVRAALGAERRHIARMLVAEGALLCLTAFACALLLTRLLLGLLAPVIETELGRPAPGGTATIAVDGTVLSIVGAAGLAIALALPFLPLLSPWQRRLADALRRAGGTATDGRSLRHLRSSLIALEVAGTLVLFIACGLLLRSVASMVSTDLGFEAERLVRGQVVLRSSDHDGPAGFFRFYEQFGQRLSAASGAPVVFSSWPPFFDLPTQSIEIDGRVGQGVEGGNIQVGPGYFAALGIPLRAGREFTAADGVTAPVAIVSDSLARRLWPDGEALGHQVRSVEQNQGGSTPGPWRTVVGIARDVRQAYADPNLADIYAPLSPAGMSRYGNFYVRSDRPPAALLAEARAAAAALDPHAVVNPLRTVVSQNRQLAGTTFLTSMLSGFAGIAGFLAVLGIYGVTAYAVQQRQREIAIRMALGAQGRRVVALFLKEGALVLVAGLALGLLGARAATRVLEHQLYGVRPLDPSVLFVSSVLLAAAGVLATWWPARRGSRANPVTSLKES